MRTLAVPLALAMVTTPLAAQRQGCAETTIPKTLPPAHDIVDSAAAIAELQAFNRLSPQMLFSLVFTDADSMPRISTLEGADAEAALVLMRSIWPQKPSGTWALRVRIARDEGAGTAWLALERSIYCPPVPDSRAPVPRPAPIRFQAHTGDHRPAPGTAHVHVRLDAWIDPDGSVSLVTVTQSSGFAELDELLVQDYQTRKFKPALIDGQPIRAIYRAGGVTPRL